jgi:hypothetical protein
MSGPVEKLQTINSLFRTLLALFVVGGMSMGGWYGYTTYTSAERESERKDQELQDARDALSSAEQELTQKGEEIASQRRQLEQNRIELADKEAKISDLEIEVTQKEEEIQRLDTALRLHKMQRRLARLTVLDIGQDPATGKQFSDIEFVELNEQGDPVGQAKRFRIEGDMIYVDYWVVKFEDKYVEEADLERGMSICMFHRIFGELQKPKDGFYLDEPGSRPGAYARGSVMSDLEKKIWDDFWNIANDAEQAAELGIRALHGDAVSIKVTKGKRYKITIRAAAGPEIQVDETGDDHEAPDDASSADSPSAVGPWGDLPRVDRIETV